MVLKLEKPVGLSILSGAEVLGDDIRNMNGG